MNTRTTWVLLVMTLAMLAALFQAPPDDTVQVADARPPSSDATAR